MRLVIIEDEAPAASRLQKLVREARPQAEVLSVIDTVEEAVEWFRSGHQPDLAFMDIQLADGLSFEIFRQTGLTVPVIFTTAYDQYALRAFKVNSLDYLLKPVDVQELRLALDKFDRVRKPQLSESVVNDLLLRLQSGGVNERRYRERFLVRVGEQLKYVPTEDIAYLLSDSGYVSIVTRDGSRLLLDHSLETLYPELDPALFFQVNRQCILHINSLVKIHTWYNSRLKLEVTPASTVEMIVSRDRVKGFKEWLDR